MLEAMQRLDMGNKDGCLPGFPEFKGSADSLYPQWSLVSRQFNCRFMEGNYGPSYTLEFIVCEGKATQSGAVMPSGGDNKIKGACMLPMLGNEKLPPIGMKFTTQALNYLRSRETARQVIMNQSMTTLTYHAREGNKDAQSDLDAITKDLDGNYQKQ